MLSSRRVRALAMLVALAIVACAGPRLDVQASSRATPRSLPSVGSLLRVTGPAGESLPVVNEKRTIALAVRDADGNPVNVDAWTSESPGTASIDSQGIVTGVLYGVATVQASVGGEIVTGTVTVTRVASRKGGRASGDTRADASGRVYLSDPTRHVVYRSDGVRDRLFAGARNKPGFTDGKAHSIRFHTPTGLGIDNGAGGGVYVADTENHCIRKIDFRRRSSVAVGPPADGSVASAGRMEAEVTPLTEARFNGPRAVAAVGDNLFVADTGNHAIYYVDIAHARVLLIAGEPGQSGLVDGPGRSARFASPIGIASNQEGDLLAIADSGNNRVRLIRLTYGENGLLRGDVSTVGVAGRAYVDREPAGMARGAGEEFIFDRPFAVAFDGVGSLLVVDETQASVVLRPPNRPPRRLQLAGAGTFASPASVALSGTRAFVLDAGAREKDRIRIVEVGPPVILGTTPSTAQLEGGAEVEVLGANFGPETRASLGDAEVLDLVVVSATRIRFIVPPQDARGARTLSVHTRGGTAQRLFHVTPPMVTDIPAGFITSVAGAAVDYRGDGGLATAALSVVAPSLSLAVDAGGALYWTEFLGHRVRCVTGGSAVLTTSAGTGVRGSDGDGGLATAAAVEFPHGVAVDGSGDVFIASGSRIRRVSAVTGEITTYAGTGEAGSSGDGGLATLAEITPSLLGFDRLGNLYMLEPGSFSVRRVSALTGLIETLFVADPDGIISIDSMAVDGDGNVYFGRTGASQVWKYSASSDSIEVWAGSGRAGFAGDGGLAVRSALSTTITSLAIGPDGSLYIADAGNGRVRRVDPSSRVIVSVAGNGRASSLENNRPALESGVSPAGIVVDGTGALYVSDITADERTGATSATIRRVDPLTGRLATYAGSGAAYRSGDGDLATSASMFALDVAVGTDGCYYFADVEESTLRRVDPVTGIVDRVAGTGRPGFDGDGGAPLLAQFNYPAALAIDASGRLFVADTGNHRIRRIDLSSGVVETVVGGGSDGDGSVVPALDVELDVLGDLAFREDGSLLFVDAKVDERGYRTARVRRFDPQTGLVVTVVGEGASGPAASIVGAEGIALHGNLLAIADPSGYVVFTVDLDTSAVEVVAGGVVLDAPFEDDIPAIEASIEPRAVTFDSAGNLLISDAWSRRVRRVDAQSGIIRSVAGGGTDEVRDGIPALEAAEAAGFALVVDRHGNLVIAMNDSIRIVRGSFDQ